MKSFETKNGEKWTFSGGRWVKTETENRATETDKLISAALEREKEARREWLGETEVARIVEPEVHMTDGHETEFEPRIYC